ncbi:hypothetical protein [Kineococcus terrestris]|uniref:hypothetical protein n=1 Tax=Kineococcus terrestris TaxID=2044856 RepID=UPI0034DAC4C2
MNELRAWLPALVGAVAAGLGGVLGAVVAFFVSASVSAPDWLFLLIVVVFGLGLGALSALSVRRWLRAGQHKP